MDGVFLSPTEDEFVGRIAEELEHFMEQGQHHRVLLFPPLSSRLRYLIHRTVENMELLSSFSVGEGWRRRTVICHSAVRLPTETTSDQKPGTNPGRGQRPGQPWGRGFRGSRLRHPGDPQGDTPRAPVGSGRITRPPRRKPEKTLYVPRGTRKKANWRERESPEEAPGGEKCPKNPPNPLGDAQREQGKEEEQQEPGEEKVLGEAGPERPPSEEKVESLGNSSDPCEQEKQDKDCSHSLCPGHDKHLAEEQDPSHASTAIREGSEFQGQAPEENQPSCDSGGLEGGKSSFSLENHGGGQAGSAVMEPELGMPSLESSRNQPSPGNQNSGDAEGGRSFSTKIREQENPSAAQEEQKPPQSFGKSPGEALELLQGADPAPREEEEDKEESDVAEALWRGLDLAAGDREGTRPRDPEDDGTAELLAEIVGNLRVKDISIERISVDYSSFGEAPVSEGDLGHVTEIFDFPSSLKTEDLMGMFSDFHESGFKIQWVDDTHALGIFSSVSTASQALGRRYPCLKIRPLIHATKQSKIKALQRPKLLHLGKERPQTDTAVARRLVSHALGWRHRQQETPGNESFHPEFPDQEE